MTDPLNVLSQDSSWYADGLRFECTGCGACCTGEPGAVWISDDEAQALADHLNLDLKTFYFKYTRKIGSKRSLIETQNGAKYDCVFLKDNRCSIYKYRPKQCRTFPWWVQNLSSRKAWEEAAKHCEGINKQASLVPADEINKHLS